MPWRSKLLIYGLTWSEGHDRVVQIERAFEKYLRAPIVWYSDTPDDRFHPRIVSKASYPIVTWRCKEMYKDVHTNFPNYDWYLRTWDDTYIVPTHIYEVLNEYDASQSIEVGRLGSHAWKGREEVFVDGGAGSLMSASAFHTFGSNLDRCMILANNNDPALGWAAEDVIFSHCKLRLNITLRSHCGFHHTSDTKKVTTITNDCRLASTQREHSGRCPLVSLHYVKDFEWLHRFLRPRCHRSFNDSSSQ